MRSRPGWWAVMSCVMCRRFRLLHAGLSSASASVIETSPSPSLPPSLPASQLHFTHCNKAFILSLWCLGCFAAPLHCSPSVKACCCVSECFLALWCALTLFHPPSIYMLACLHLRIKGFLLEHFLSFGPPLQLCKVTCCSLTCDNFMWCIVFIRRLICTAVSLGISSGCRRHHEITPLPTL